MLVDDNGDGHIGMVSPCFLYICLAYTGRRGSAKKAVLMYVIRYGFEYCPVAKMLLVKNPEATQSTMTIARSDKPSARRHGVLGVAVAAASSSGVQEYEGIRGDPGGRGIAWKERGYVGSSLMIDGDFASRSILRCLLQ